MITTIYRSKIGIELILPLILVFGTSSALFVYYEAWVGLAINITAIVGISCVCLHTTYTSEGNILCIKSPLILPVSNDIESIQKINELGIQ